MTMGIVLSPRASVAHGLQSMYIYSASSSLDRK